MAKMLLLHGPNLNLLGAREPDLYGSESLASINQRLIKLAADAGHDLQVLQSNAEHVLVERIHEAKNEGVKSIVINPAAFTHTSVALRDALLATGIPFAECHMSNIHNREAFRQQSYLSDIAIGVVCGFGALSYELALTAAMQKLQ